jgi:hypothetical protein
MARRLTVNQVMQLIEGAELVAQSTGLSISEVVNLVLNEPEEEPVAEPRPRAVGE